MSKYRLLGPGSSNLMIIFHYDHLWPSCGHATSGHDHLNNLTKFPELGFQYD